MSEQVPYVIPKFSPIKARVYNLINAVLPDSSDFSLLPFMEDDNPLNRGICYCNCNGSVVRIRPLADDYLDEDDILKDVPIDSLPPELLEVAIEIAYADELELFRNVTGAYANFCEPPDEYAPDTEIFVRFKHHEKFVHIGIAFYGEGADGIINTLESLNKQNSLSIVGKLPVSMHFDAGHVILDGLELQNLRPGDVLLPDDFYLAKNELRCNLKSNALVFDYDMVSKAVLKGITASSYKDEKEQMTDEINADNAETELNSDVSINTKDLKFEVFFELERRELEFDEIANLKQGSVINLTCSKQTPVTIRINGRAVGTGRLVDLGSNIGVQIMEIKE